MLYTGTTAAARARLERVLSYATEPALSATEVTDLLNDSRRASLDGTSADSYADWAASTAYAVGAEVVPTTRNDHYYRVTVSDGQSGATEPTWPTTSGATVSLDGVTYQEVGATSWSPTWDLDWAAAEGYEIKAARVAHKFAHSADGHSFHPEQQGQAFLEMADKYRAKIQSSAPVLGRRDDLYETGGLVP